MKFENLNLNSLRFMTSQMTTRWIPDGLDEEGASERFMVTPKNFPKYDVNNISMRVMAQPISAEKVKVMIGIAPVP
jgi:hypothetical protein